MKSLFENLRSIFIRVSQKVQMKLIPKYVELRSLTKRNEIKIKYEVIHDALK